MIFKGRYAIIKSTKQRSSTYHKIGILVKHRRTRTIMRNTESRIYVCKRKFASAPPQQPGKWAKHPPPAGWQVGGCYIYPTLSALITASSAFLYRIISNAVERSSGTEAKSDILIAGIKIFFAPLSRHTCNVFASSSTRIRVPLADLVNYRRF